MKADTSIEQKRKTVSTEKLESAFKMLIVSLFSIIGLFILYSYNSYKEKVNHGGLRESYKQSLVANNLFDGSYGENKNLLEFYNITQAPGFMLLVPNDNVDWLDNYDMHKDVNHNYRNAFIVNSEGEVLGYLPVKELPLKYDYLEAYNVNPRHEDDKALAKTYLILKVDASDSQKFSKIIETNGVELISNQEDLSQYIKDVRFTSVTDFKLVGFVLNGMLVFGLIFTAIGLFLFVPACHNLLRTYAK